MTIDAIDTIDTEVVDRATETPDSESGAAAQRLAELLSPERVDALLADAEASGLAIDGPNGLINQMIKAVLERALDVEMADHLGYDRGDPAGVGSGNSRNGHTSKTVITSAGQTRVEVPRDRNSSFEPQIVPKRRRRLGNTTDMILSLYARGMTTRDIKAHLGEVYGVYGVEVSHETVAKVTDVVADEVRAWQARPVDEVYPIVFIDGLRIKVRDGGAVTNKVAHLVVGVDIDGFKHVLGIWMQTSEGAKFWLGVFTELRNRGLRDPLIACCDGLTGLPDAITTIWPDTIVQTCVVHLLRTSLRYVSYDHKKKLAGDLKPIYTAPSLAAAEAAFADFKTVYQAKSPGVIAVWERAWEEFIPFLDFPVPIRKVIYTTNQIESINFQLRKVTKNRGHFPNDDAAIKLLYLALRNINPARGGDLGTGTYGWKQALNAFAIHFPGRLPN
jgi:putative transposase